MQHQVPVLPASGDKIARSGEADHHLLLFLAGVTGDVNRQQAVVINSGPQTEQIVKGTMYQFLVAGDGRGRKDHRVTVLNVHLTVFLIGHANQGTGRLALGAGAHNCHPRWRECFQILRAQEHIIGGCQIAQVARHAHVLDHATPHHAQATIVPESTINHLLNPGYI